MLMYIHSLTSSMVGCFNISAGILLIDCCVDMEAPLNG